MLDASWFTKQGQSHPAKRKMTSHDQTRRQAPGRPDLDPDTVVQDVAAVQVTASIPLVKQVQTERESARTMRSVRHDAYRMELQSRHWVRVLRNLHTSRILGPPDWRHGLL